MDKPQLPKMLKKLHLLVFFVCALIGFSSKAQTFPVTISTQILQPSPIYLSNYADATTINSPIKVQLVLNDLTISNRQVRLKIYFQGNSISLASNDFVVGARPLYLEGGFPLQLTNVDLAPYFEYQNILGVNPNQYAQPLPEGVYNISVEVYDFATNKKLSKKTAVTTIIFQNEPPFLNLPLNGASIMQQNIQNIVFSWTPRSINVSNVEYEFSLVEIWDNYTPVQNAFAYSPPLYTTTTRNTTLQYGITQPQLIPGKKYAWRIKAKAILGAEEIGVFKNNGYSEIFSFTYEVFCTAPLSIATSGVSQDQAKITWSGSIDNYDYQVNYREKNSRDWYKLVTPRETINISNLKPNTTYEYTVGSSCDVGKYTHSTIHEFTTLAQDEIAFAGCGIQPDPNDLKNKNPLPSLFPNDVVTAGDFPIVVIKATGSNGNFTGEGYVTLPFLEKFRKLIDAADALGGEKINIGKFSRIRITFNNIGVNTDFKLISGEIVASYDPNWGGMADLDGVVNDAFGDAGNVVNHQYELSIKSVVKNPDGTITVTSTTGVVSVIDKTVNDVIITDKDGKQFAVPANAPAGDMKQTGQLAPGGIPTSKNTNGMGSGGDVAEISSADVNIIFSKGNGTYSFDTSLTAENGKLNKTYQTIPQKNGGTYKVNYKAISESPNSTDVVVATVDFKNGKTKKDLVFKTQNGTAIDSTQIVWKDNVATLSLKKTLDFAKETIIATVRPATPKDPKEAAGKYDIAGTMDLWHLTNKKVNVTLVSVNNAKIPSDVQKELNAIYQPAGITFEVSTANITLDNTWGDNIETSESDLLNTYTPEQQQITANLKSKLGTDYKKDTYYMIYTDAASSKSNLLGFMPLKRQYGFIFNQKNSVRTLAHELGHGVFGLQHPFTEYSTATTTDLLMDYGTGVLLSHNDWQVLHAPGLQLYPFIQGDSDGEFNGGFAITPDFKFISVNSTTTTGGARVDVPNGTLYGFVENKKYYVWDGKNSYYNIDTNDKEPFTNFNKVLPKDTDNVFLFYDSKNICGLKKYLVVKYENIKSIKTLENLAIFIKNNESKGERLNCSNNENIKGWTEDEVNKDISGLYVVNLIKPGQFKEEVYNKLKELVSNSSTNKITDENHHIKSRILLTSEIAADNQYNVSVKTEDGKEYFYINNTKQEIISNEIIFWIEYNKEGKIRIKHIIAGDEFDQALANSLKSWDSQLDWKQKTFFEKFLSASYSAVDNYFTSAYDLLDMLGSGIGKLKIQPSVYDCKAKDYNSVYAEVFSYVNFISIAQDVVAEQLAGQYPNIKTILQNGTPSQVQFALFCGLYNGLIDVIKSVPDLAKLIVSPLSEKGRSSNSEFIEAISNKIITEEMPDGTQKELYGIGLSPSKIGYLIKELLGKQFDTTQPCKTAEFVGSIAGPFIVMCFGDEVAAEGIASKIFSSTLKVINICSKITDPFHYLGLSFKFVKQLTGKLTIVGENVAGDVIHQVADNAFNVKLITAEAGSITNEVSGEVLEKIIANTGKGETTEIIINGVKKAVRIVGAVLPNTTTVFKEFVTKTKTLVIATSLTFQVAGASVATFSKSAQNVLEQTIQVAGKTDLTNDILAVIPKIESQAAEQFTNAVTTSIKKSPTAVAQQGKLVMLEGVDQIYDVLAVKIGNEIDYLVIKEGTNSIPSAIYRVPRKAEPEQKSKCEYCPEVNTLESEMCKKLTLLAINTNNSQGVKNICGKGISLAVVNKLLSYDTSIQKIFINDFIYADSQVIKNFDLSLLDLWKKHNLEFKGRKYITDEGQFETCQNVADKHPSGYLGNLVQKVMQAETPSSQQQVVVGVTHPTFDGEVFLGYNFKNGDIAEEQIFLSTGCHPILRDRIKYMDFIRNSVTDKDGKIINPEFANKLLDIDNLDKLTRAGRAGYHGEVRALSAALYKLGNKATEQSLSEFDMFIRSRGDKVMQRCPNCFHISYGVKVLEGK